MRLRAAVGIKTGYTDDAGHCLLFEAVRNDRALIGVVLDSRPPARRPARPVPRAEFNESGVLLTLSGRVSHSLN